MGELLKDPYCQLPLEIRLGGGEGAKCRLLVTSPFEMFMSRLKVGAPASLVMSSPWRLYQIQVYITPGLVYRERRITCRVVTAAMLLLVMDSVLVHFVVATDLESLLQIGEGTQIPVPTDPQYFGLPLASIVCPGASSEAPLFLVMLGTADVVTYESVKDRRSIIIMSLFILAAFVTPGREPTSMVTIAAVLILSVEIAIQICRIHDRRKAEERPERLGVDGEQGSGSIMVSGPAGSAGDIGGVGGINAPTSVSAPTLIQLGGMPTASVAPTTSPISGPMPVPTSTPTRISQVCPTRNSRPPRLQGTIPETPMLA